MAEFEITFHFLNTVTCQGFTQSWFQVGEEVGWVDESVKLAIAYTEFMSTSVRINRITQRNAANPFSSRVLTEADFVGKMAGNPAPDWQCQRIRCTGVLGASSLRPLRGFTDDSFARNPTSKKWELQPAARNAVDSWATTLVTDAWGFQHVAKPPTSPVLPVQDLSYDDDGAYWVLTSLAHGVEVGDEIFVYGKNAAKFREVRGWNYASAVTDDLIYLRKPKPCDTKPYVGGLAFFKKQEVVTTIVSVQATEATRHKTGLPTTLRRGRRTNRVPSSCVSCTAFNPGPAPILSSESN